MDISFQFALFNLSLRLGEISSLFLVYREGGLDVSSFILVSDGNRCVNFPFCSSSKSKAYTSIDANLQNRRFEDFLAVEILDSIFSGILHLFCRQSPKLLLRLGSSILSTS